MSFLKLLGAAAVGGAALGALASQKLNKVFNRDKPMISKSNVKIVEVPWEEGDTGNLELVVMKKTKKKKQE